MNQFVTLVDQNNQPIGKMEKMEAHRKGKLHRAFSVFVFNTKGELLLQRRAFSKYHSGGLWTNTCCSHPLHGEDLVDSAKRRMIEEMGFECEIEEIFSFIYRAELDNDLIEHELDHVLIGYYSGHPEVNPEEVAEYRYVSMEKIRKELEVDPAMYTEWFKIIFDRVSQHLQQNQAL